MLLQPEVPACTGCVRVLHLGNTAVPLVRKECTDSLHALIGLCTET